jgi:endonuclease/exonuclease/phosphatase family metal-dependent hydrolase
VDAGSLRSDNIDQIQYLARQASFPYWYHQVNRNLGRFAQHSNGLLSRVRPGPVSEHKLPGLPGRGAVVVDLPLSDGGSLRIGIVHLALGWRARQRQLEYLVELARSNPLTVLMGDFNCSCRSNSLRTMVRRAGLHGLDCELKTFPSWRPQRNLDHILASRALGIEEARVIDYALSDHLPISVTLRLPEGVSLVTEAGPAAHSWT